MSISWSQLEYLWAWVTPAGIGLFLLACAGHLAWQVEGLNWYLGFPWPRWFSKLVRRLNTLLIFTGPPLIWWAFAVGLDHLAGYGWGTAVFVYVWFCWIFAAVFVPLSLLRYAFRPLSKRLVGNHSEVVDVAAELGYRPVGHGKYRPLALLPGNQIFQVEFNEKHLGLPGLPPEWDGLSILHLTDLHFRGIPDRPFYRRVMEHCGRWQPDLIALTGDVVDSEKHYRWIVPMLGRLRCRVAAFAILGNHDQWYEPQTVRRRLRRIGMRVLANRWELLEVRGRPLAVIGHEGPWFRPPPDLTDCPRDAFRLCLSHTPDNIAWARRQGIQLMLSGHNHGGQIRLPVVGSVYVPSRYGRRYDCGAFDEGPTLLHVGRGLAGQHPVRLNCRPEVTLLILHPGR